MNEIFHTVEHARFAMATNCRAGSLAPNLQWLEGPKGRRSITKAVAKISRANQIDRPPLTWLVRLRHDRTCRSERRLENRRGSPDALVEGANKSGPRSKSTDVVAGCQEDCIGGEGVGSLSAVVGASTPEAPLGLDGGW